jgi:diguanylate cyclase (GGDEF)-like protein
LTGAADYRTDPPHDRPSVNILIADDEPGTRLLLTATLERMGHACTTAEDGDEAWERYRELSPDVVVTDWQMPGRDGTQLARDIRAHESGYTYLLVLTGAADEEAARAVMEAGADDLLLKPLDTADLGRKLIAAERVTALHRRMHADARHDPLTGIGNRLRLAEDLLAICARVERYGHSYCVAVFDIDSFKAYNDAAGHLGGDDVLRHVAHALRDAARGGDAVYRYGGEEFVVLLPEQTLETAGMAAERLRATVEALALPHPAGGVVTVSAGVAGLGNGAVTPEELFAAADAALYAAKAAGRNRVEAVVVDAGAGESPIRVLIADDEAAIRLTVGAVLGREDGIELVGEATDAPAAIELAALRRPDVVILDFDMPGGGGVHAAVSIREASPTTRIVALSADESAGAHLDMSRAGAVGYVVKGAAPDEIVRAIRSAVRW